MLIQIFAALLLSAHAESAFVRCIMMSQDEKAPVILETKIAPADPGSGRHFKVVAPVKLSEQSFDHRIEFPADEVFVCEQDKTALILSTSDCNETTVSDALRVEFRNVGSWQNTARIQTPSVGDHPMIIGDFNKVYCFWSKY